MSSRGFQRRPNRSFVALIGLVLTALLAMMIGFTTQAAALTQAVSTAGVTASAPSIAPAVVKAKKSKKKKAKKKKQAKAWNYRTLRAGNLPGWRSVFSEGFDKAAPLGTFNSTYTNFGDYPYGWKDTSKHGTYHTARTTSVGGGMLNVDMHYDASLGKYLVAALLPHMQTMRFGRFDIRMRAQAGAGYKVVPLLWPDSDQWPSGGEVDFPETDLDGSSPQAFAHFAQSSGGQNVFKSGANLARFTTYTTIWRNGLLRFLVNGHQIGKSTYAVPTTPMHWVMQMETAVHDSAPPTDSHGRVQVDWIKAYAPR